MYDSRRTAQGLQQLHFVHVIVVLIIPDAIQADALQSQNLVFLIQHAIDNAAASLSNLLQLDELLPVHGNPFLEIPRT